MRRSWSDLVKFYPSKMVSPNREEPPRAGLQQKESNTGPAKRTLPPMYGLRTDLEDDLVSVATILDNSPSYSPYPDAATYIAAQAHIARNPIPQLTIPYRTDCPTLPSDRPSSFPHVVDLDHFNSEEHAYTNQLSCADAVATFLWKWDQKQLERFFDLSVPRCKINYTSGGRLAGYTSLVISRDERVVRVSRAQSSKRRDTDCWV